MMTLTTPADAVRTARRHCSEGCFAYHAAWRLFRRTGLKGNPAWHLGFYRTAVERWKPDPERRLRILVAGAADETALSVLDRLLGRDRLEIHLIDACPTPLHLARAHAYWTGTDLHARSDRVPELATCVGPFDLIVTDGLLSLLPTAGQRTVTVARFARLLADDGLLLYTARIAGPSGQLEYDRLGRHVMAATALAAWPGTPAERLRLARALRTRPARTAPFTSAAELTDCFRTSFTQVHTHTRARPHTLPLALAPSVRAGRGSTSVGIAATGPNTRPGSCT